MDVVRNAPEETAGLQGDKSVQSWENRLPCSVKGSHDSLKGPSLLLHGAEADALCEVSYVGAIVRERSSRKRRQSRTVKEREVLRLESREASNGRGVRDRLRSERRALLRTRGRGASLLKRRQVGLSSSKAMLDTSTS